MLYCVPRKEDIDNKLMQGLLRLLGQICTSDDSAIPVARVTDLRVAIGELELHVW